MEKLDIARLRLQAQQISTHSLTSPGDVVSWLGAMQAQDYPGAKWAIALRLPNTTEAEVEQAIAHGSIVRTWPMRHTLHFVAPADIRWMLDLLAPRVIAAAAGRRRNLHLDDEVLEQSRRLIVDALQGGKCLTRSELYAILDAGNIATAAQRGIHIFSYFCLNKLLCFGPRSEKQPTFVLLDEWIPPAAPLERDQALTELAVRYFSSHGPAQVVDFVWWSGLKVSDARQAIELTGTRLSRLTVEGQDYWMDPKLTTPPRASSNAYLLPGFDEFMLGYRDRTAALPIIHNQSINPGANGMFAGTIVIDGQVEGTWRRTIKSGAISISLSPFKPLTKSQLSAISTAVESYGAFMYMPVNLLN